ncbi:MAG TPA: hypothetical protein VHW95_08215 [Steroidobacteraceae bacterium]|nr:hypothetical protein [Steroidobacteraceae bacterium]
MGPGALEIWLNHFEHHARRRRVQRSLSDVLRPHERHLIACSIAIFQLGEQSDGRLLLRAAERFANQNGAPNVARIFELLIREQQRHARLLRAFMQDHGIRSKKADCTDRVFRLIRRLAGLQLYVSVLICAELIGQVYYRALESVTDCKRLQVLCRSIVSDELAHVGFESQLLFELRAGRPAPLRAVARPAHRAFFAVTAGVVWLTHRSVLSRGGHSARSFLRACLAQYAFYLEPAGVRLAATS